MKKKDKKNEKQKKDKRTKAFIRSREAKERYGEGL